MCVRVCACLRVQRLTSAALCVYSFIKPNHPTCCTPLCPPCSRALVLIYVIVFFCFLFVHLHQKHISCRRLPVLMPLLIGLIIHRWRSRRCVKVGVCGGKQPRSLSRYTSPPENDDSIRKCYWRILLGPLPHWPQRRCFKVMAACIILLLLAPQLRQMYGADVCTYTCPRTRAVK